MKVAILGGSFNPIHNSHLKLITYLTEHNLVDEVWVMPCKKHPLDKFLDKEEHRVAMVKLAIEGLDKIKFCDFELKQKGSSYTYETLRKLRKEYSHNFYWIIGSDILKQLPSWYGYEHLQKEASFLIFPRKGYDTINPGITIEKIIDCDSDTISSTKVRDRVKQGKSISSLVPKKVEEYIFKNGLYKK